MCICVLKDKEWRADKCVATWADLSIYLNTLNKQQWLCDILVSINYVVSQLVDDDIKWTLLLYWLAQIQLDRENKVKSSVNIHETFFNNTPPWENSKVNIWIGRGCLFLKNAPACIIVLPLLRVCVHGVCVCTLDG